MEARTKVHHPLDYSSRINVLRSTKESRARVKEMRNPQPRHKGMRETDGLNLVMMMEGNMMDGRLTTSLVRAS